MATQRASEDSASSLSMSLSVSTSTTSSVNSTPATSINGDSVTSSRASATLGPSLLKAFVFGLLPSMQASSTKRADDAEGPINNILLDPLPISRIPCGDDFCLSGLRNWVNAYTTRFKASEKRARTLPKSDRDHWMRVMDSDRSRLPTGHIDIVHFVGSYHLGISISQVLLGRQYIKRQHAQISLPPHRKYIKLVIGWKGYPTQTHKVLVHCQCDTDRMNPNGTFITRITMATLVAIYYQHLFSTHKPSEDGGILDMSLPEHFSRLRLLCIWSTDKKTWHAQLGYVTHEKLTISNQDHT